MSSGEYTTREILSRADELQKRLGSKVHDKVTSSIFSAATQVASDVVSRDKQQRVGLDVKLDRILTSRAFGVPLMLLLLAFVFWITIVGSNLPSSFLASLLIEEGGLQSWFAENFGWTNLPGFLSVSLYGVLSGGLGAIGVPAWVIGFFIDGVYLGLAWVVAVMLPPMAIFFPLFTLLEDLGYLPRIAFNLDRYFRSVGAHGKQALTMAMGFGCNAAGIIACRIIESPRERIIAIITNNFVPCNGRWPTLIMMTSIFIVAAFPAGLATLISVGALLATTIIGVLMTLLVSWMLSSTVLKGVASSFFLEMPPYRKPQVGRIIYTSLIDRTWFVLKRAIIFSAPAGAVIWLLGAIHLGGGEVSLYQFLAASVNPFAQAIGLDGVILLAFIVAIPANEIVIPTIIMGYMNVTRMTELSDPSMLFLDNGWTMLTAVCLMLFSLLHYPCTTTTMTIWAETRSVKWTLFANLIPLAVAIIVCFSVAQTAYFLGWA